MDARQLKKDADLGYPRRRWFAQPTEGGFGHLGRKGLHAQVNLVRAGSEPEIEEAVADKNYPYQV